MFVDDDWRARAACRADNAVYFFAPNHFERKPEKDLREGIARSLCRRCPVRQTCLEHALSQSETNGIWGGLNELERRRLQRLRAAEQTARRGA
jgi:WhiB family redox-sensing transcriptional regulator